MLTERLLSIAAELPVNETQMLTDLNPESKVAISAISGAINLFIVYVLSRTMDGSVNSKWEKGIVTAGTLGFTVGNAIVNHQIWT
ncbi:hypothetical protein A3J17_00390 [Candidatus Curtissbacteria bacterium RIFCSPLOWO2_02_FULL_40_11]|uniref:Uncharacterized protein n=1 Tax=Candidatus Curtissbacteria bacterium RIFCSPLOWO2_12_FULL_38_9 TaxID=1797735 RepID=A0A1F5IC02_9BACT|nr:MAG: hypothetical protein A3E11_01100 [Candidatus Curtissbacteria bacterium RIFCSPHIGHO2_12_FULL_38_37]OGE01517.1 MAG: hypothetical protein A3J17_00390 [Candidatus Curtissbacteria bacterium RIFCSPLOWO2_02_FULL_40_11]OGE13851.1 MAG: hypothetical protein A3G14_01735 [Candidatus Curtissbacteria bacterium RIFCSPLOWO2_12_FULL_38_9]